MTVKSLSFQLLKYESGHMKVDRHLSSYKNLVRMESGHTLNLAQKFGADRHILN